MRTHTTRPVSVADTLAGARLGIADLVVMVTSAAAPMTVIAAGATLQWAVTGQLGIPIAYLAVAAILTVFAVGLVDMSSHITNAGAFYAYITHGLGRHLGVGGSFIAVLAYNAMAVGMLGGAGAIASSWLADEFKISTPWWICALAFWALVALFGTLRIDLNGKFLLILLGGEILVAAGLAVVHVTHPAGGALTFDALNISSLFSGSGAVLMVIGVTGFVGFEQTVVYAEEAKRPERTVRQATFLSLALIGGLYAFASWAMSVAAGPDNIVALATEHGTELTFVLAGPYIPAFINILGHVLFVTSLLAGYLAFHNTAARYHYSLGREGVLPSWLGKISARTSAPMAGSLLQSAIGFSVVMLYAAMSWDPELYLFFWGTCIGGLGVLILMTLTSAAIPAYTWTRRRNSEETSLLRGVVAPLIALVPLTWILVQTMLNIHIMLGLEPGDPLTWAAPVAFLSAAVAGVVWAAVARRARPDVYDRIGQGTRIAADLAKPIGLTAGSVR
ncbi:MULTISPECIES: APC family permease [Catenuloplanes]|uniref:Amino acid transporter n=1 Tax=Catenuloplanes niger TaxID=587534 RepID=A0AAE4CRA7_9ACTN|nr:APC family permease [Catenuloplanes niger]MDR7322661.1 amino acid transporter [Catenuloplanes niger]